MEMICFRSGSMRIECKHYRLTAREQKFILRLVD